MVNKSRLLFYCHALVGGGAERLWVLLASGLKRRGHDVHFAVDFLAEQNAGFLDPAIPLHVLGPHHGQAIREMARLLRRVQPDAALSALGASNAKLLLAKPLAGWPGHIIQTYHGRLATEARPLGRLSYLLTALSSRLTWRTVAVSHDLRQYLVKTFHSNPRRTLAIPNAVVLPSPPTFTAETLAKRPDVVVAIGRLVPEKGMDRLIEALHQLTSPVRLIILGEGPERARLIELAHTLGLTDRVELRGYVKDPSPIFAEAKMLALTSTTEAFGNVIVEALSHGLPVVATACGGPVEILNSGRFGRLVPIGDVMAIARAIEQTLNDPGDPMAHYARAKDFDLETTLTHYEAMLDGVIPS